MAKRNMPPKNVPPKEEPTSKVVDLHEEVTNEPIELVVANCAKLNVRVKPDKGSDVLFIIPEGTLVHVDEVVGAWFHIFVLGNETKKGYALAQYLKER